MQNIPSKKAGAPALGFAVAVFLCQVSVVQAQGTQTQTSGATANSAQQRLLVSDMMKSSVTGSTNKKIGDIKDVVVDVASGKVRYAILEFDPGFFKSEKLFAIPVTAFAVNANGKGLAYREVSRAQMERAALDKSDWVKAVENKAYLTNTDRNYGFKPPAGTAQSMRASKIIGRDVNSRMGKDIGTIKDMVVDLGTGNVKFAVFSFDPSWFNAGKLFAFPLTSFKVDNEKDELMLDVDKNMLASMKNFDADRWGSLNDLNRDNLVNTVPGSAMAR